MLSLQDVSAGIAGISVLRHISAEFRDGSMTAVVGRNGAGKTTLLRLVMGFVPFRQGRVTLDGQDLADVPAHRRASLGIGYAPEDRVLFPSFSVEENLRFPCEVARIDAKEIGRRLDEVVSIVPELEPMLGRSGAALSGGQGKMVALGRALMAGTRVVMLDEPFQGLAPILAVQYAESLRRLHVARPTLAIIVTESNRSLLRDIPDTTLTLERGALQADATGPGIH